jgi:hypothetical protein
VWAAVGVVLLGDFLLRSQPPYALDAFTHSKDETVDSFHVGFVGEDDDDRYGTEHVAPAAGNSSPKAPAPVFQSPKTAATALEESDKEGALVQALRAQAAGCGAARSAQGWTDRAFHPLLSPLGPG